MFPIKQPIQKSTETGIMLSDKQHDDRVFARKFVQFLGRDDPTVLAIIVAVSETATHRDAAYRLGVSEYEYCRLHERFCASWLTCCHRRGGAASTQPVIKDETQPVVNACCKMRDSWRPVF